jgi:hypothetical protein
MLMRQTTESGGVEGRTSMRMSLCRSTFRRMFAIVSMIMHTNAPTIYRAKGSSQLDVSDIILGSTNLPCLATMLQVSNAPDPKASRV